ncbi:MAG: 2-polyprenyl-3-methyl-5-hydroxy-6-metoxy,4-benzoquinol methylase [Modestobacter sp.]|nr:2-polyprenyl-3-methyl-5-hydroxy-6-metoxy,4-benzoquinol methylase [Modestobacter sp.]
MRRNDPAQYDERADQWWDPAGGFAMLHWLAASRAEHVPPAAGRDALLVDLACGGGLMAPHVARLGYRHVGVDIGRAGLEVARDHGVRVIRGSVLAVPLADGCADVVLAGEVLEHVADHAQLLRECARLLRPGGTLVVDAIAATRLADLVAVRIGERVPGGPPPGIHDPALFVDRAALVALAGRLGIELRLVGLRPSVRDLLARRRAPGRNVRMRPMRYTGVLFAGYGTKRAAVERRAVGSARTVGDMTEAGRLDSNAPVTGS